MADEGGLMVGAAGNGSGAADTEEENTNKVWRDERWLQYNELNEQSVLDYFALSDW